MKTITQTSVDHKETSLEIKKPAIIHLSIYGALFIAWFVMQLHK